MFIRIATTKFVSRSIFYADFGAYTFLHLHTPSKQLYLGPSGFSSPRRKIAPTMIVLRWLRTRATCPCTPVGNPGASNRRTKRASKKFWAKEWGKEDPPPTLQLGTLGHTPVIQNTSETVDAPLNNAPTTPPRTQHLEEVRDMCSPQSVPSRVFQTPAGQSGRTDSLFSEVDENADFLDYVLPTPFFFGHTFLHLHTPSSTRRALLPEIRIATWNMRGIIRAGRRAELDELVSKLSCDIMLLQETHSLGNSSERLPFSGYDLLFSSGATAHERHGVGFAVHPRISKMIDTLYFDHSRVAAIVFNTHPLPLLVINLYFPTAATALEEKIATLDRLNAILDGYPNAIPILGGDFNTRVIDNDGVAQYFGTHFFASQYTLETAPEEILENRELILEFLINRGMVFLNTLFDQAPSAQLTFKFSTTDGFRPPFSSDRFAQMDYLATKYCFRNAFSDVRSHTDKTCDSDHSPICGRFKFKLSYARHAKQPSRRKYVRPTPEQITHFNNTVTERVLSGNDRDLSAALCASATLCLPTAAMKGKVAWLSAAAKDLLNRRNDHLAMQDSEMARELTKLFRKQARKDKKAHQIKQLETFLGPQQNWKAIKQLRKEYQPTPIIRNRSFGCRPALYAQEAADYLTNVHWAPNPTISSLTLRAHQSKFPPLLPDNVMPDWTIGHFTLDELDTVIKDLKANKSPGPDEVTTDM
eukprot:6483908-Amphidinium_carterae.2